MSINLFADRKMAMGFAGVIAGLAMIAGLSMGAFAPRGDDDVQGSQQPDRVAVIDRTAPPPTRQHTSTWASDGVEEESGSDDWAGAGASAPATFEAEQSAASAGDDVPGPEFGEYVPDQSRKAPAAPRQATARTPGSPVIRSRAAANAPALKAPGEDSTPPRLTLIE